jgi:hypothetical protein
MVWGGEAKDIAKSHRGPGRFGYRRLARKTEYVLHELRDFYLKVPKVAENAPLLARFAILEEK